MLWVATAALAAVTALSTWFAVSIVPWGSRYGELRGHGSTYLESGGWVLGVVTGLLLTGAGLLLFHTVTGRTPSKRLMIGTALVSLLLMQVALFITGEYGVRTAGAAEETCTTEAVELLEEIHASIVAGGDATRPEPAGIDPVVEQSTGHCVVGEPGTEAVPLDVLETDGWTRVDQDPSGYTFERGDHLILLTFGDGDGYRIEVPR
jgi:hypothetical protein